jgi:DNA-binding response OmpR family regulator
VKAAGNILVADDEAGCLNMTAAALRRQHYECDTASDATEAAHMLSEKEYDLLISDLEMPGNEDLRLIRNVPQIAAGLPVILMTAYPTVETAIQSIQLPVTAYLIKPFSHEQLFTETRRAVESSQAYRAIRINHQRIAEWNRALDQLETSLKHSRQPEATPWQTLLELTLRNITDAATDLRVFAEFTARHPGPEAQGEPLDAARPLQLLNALRETITVLEKTRSAFKSKDLGELRHKLETLLKSHPN